MLGAGGGVGISAVEIGKAMGARVIAAASSTEKLQAASGAGADELINYSDGELKEKVKALTGGKGADVIYDPVGGALFDQCMRCINWYGRVLVIGFAAGDIPKLSTNLVLLKSCQVVGVFSGPVGRCVSEANTNFREILEALRTRQDQSARRNVYPLEQYADALRLPERTSSHRQSGCKHPMSNTLIHNLRPRNERILGHHSGVLHCALMAGRWLWNMLSRWIPAHCALCSESGFWSLVSGPTQACYTTAVAAFKH